MHIKPGQQISPPAQAKSDELQRVLTRYDEICELRKEEGITSERVAELEAEAELLRTQRDTLIRELEELHPFPEVLLEKNTKSLGNQLGDVTERLATVKNELKTNKALSSQKRAELTQEAVKLEYARVDLIRAIEKAVPPEPSSRRKRRNGSKKSTPAP